jgi:ATP-binding cassette subfamily F protein 3
MKFALTALSVVLAVSSCSTQVWAFSNTQTKSFAGVAKQILTTTTTTTTTRPKNNELPSDFAFVRSNIVSSEDSITALFAKKKKANNAKAAALEALEALEAVDSSAGVIGVATETALPWDDDEPLSKKDAIKAKKAAEKKKKQEEKKKEQEKMEQEADGKKDRRAAALKALEEMERMEAETAASEDSSVADIKGPKMSKKEAKMAAKKAAKEAAKKAAKEAKKAARKAELEGTDIEGVNGVEEPDVAAADVEAPVNGSEATPAPEKKKKLTLEERIRKERPPPRVRVMESSQPDFSSLRLENVGIIFRDQEVLKDVTWGVKTGDRIGLVGANGAGKTTQLKIMNGELESTTGDVVKSNKDLKVAMLRQEFVDELVPERTLKEEFMSVFKKETQILNDLRASEQELEQLDAVAEPDKMQEILDRMQDLQSQADTNDVYALESRATKIMNLMGFEEDEEELLVAMFSGGWKMRIGLGKVLLEDPNILLLDEPTNHLDLESVEWLEEFLRNQNIPMVIVSHDREFLDRVCNKIVDAEGGICTEYDGNYSQFLQLKKARMDAWNAAYNAQEKKIKEERAWCQKFKIKQPQAVKQRLAKLEKMKDSKDYVQKPPFVGKPFRFRFPDAPRLSPEVADIRGLSHGYGEGTNRLFEDCELFVEKNDRIAVLGPNGSGKSTLLRLLVGKEEPDEGSAEIVGENIVMNYFEQNQADALDLNIDVVSTVQKASNGQSYNELRALLGQFLFKGDAVEKKVANLSGGEKARLSLACMMLEPANLLILDEPTNHLDIPAKEMLEEALQHFQGSVIVVSHDRYFISRVGTTIVAVEDKKLTKYQGDYKFYMDKSKYVKEKVEARRVKGVDAIGSAPVINFEEMEVVKKKKNFGGAKTANMVTKKNKGVKNAKRQGM